ncbi:MAG: class I SAM-dependent methyltransferase [bacterium]
MRKLELSTGDRFLDCPCGIGRISLPLARKGIAVTAVDNEPSYIQELEQRAGRASLPITTVLADMRQIEFRSRFKAAANLWTSFGYFEREADDLLVLRRVFRSLRRGGRFVLQTINRDFLIAHWQQSNWEEVGDLTILQRHSLDYRTSRLSSTWTFLKDGQTRAREIPLRLYSYHELVDMFERVGFVDIEGFGSTDDAPVDCNCRVLWVFGVKP